MPRPFPDQADREELRRRYRLEKELARRLREASPEERQERYADVYGAYAESVPSQGDDLGSLALQRDLLKPWLRPGQSVVEIGAGSGATARSMLGEGRRIVAIEASVPQNASSGNAGEALEWISHEETSLLGDSSFDLAYSCHVIEHLHPEDLPAHFADALRWLRPGAPYLFVTPNRLHGPHDISAYFADEPEGLHLREYSHGDLARLARQAGFGSVTAVNRLGIASSLWSILVAEGLLELSGRHFRRFLFDGIEALRRRMPLRPLEQVTLAAFAPGGEEENENR